MKVPPSLMLAMISVVSFWASLALYVFMGMTQHSFNPSLSRLFAATVAVVGVIALAVLTYSQVAALQVVIWGGNLAYMGSVFGWFITDAFRRAADRDQTVR